MFSRLADHGIGDDEYPRIKKIASFDLPQARLQFIQEFGHERTLQEILEQLECWKQHLKHDYLLDAGSQTELKTRLDDVEMVAWRALWEANLGRVGPWQLQWEVVSTGQQESGRHLYIRPGMRVSARHSETHEIRETSIPGEALNSPPLWAGAIKKAYEDLGILDLLWKGRPGKDVASVHDRPGWPVFTQFVIPRLYEFMRPYYRKRGYYSEKFDCPGPARPARYPRDLLEDMLDILRVEHPKEFEERTTAHLKSAIQTHLERQQKVLSSR